MSTLAPARHILIVEEDHQLGDMLADMLQMEGYQTDRAATLKAALSKINEQLYDFVLTDLLTHTPPPRDGRAYLNTVQQLRQQCHPVPVGILTGWSVDLNAAERAGFAFAFQKPYDIDAVLRRIADHLNAPFTPEQQQQAQILRSYLHAFSLGNEEMLRALCTPSACYYPLTRNPLTSAREIIGVEAYLAYVQQVHWRLPDLRIEHVIIFQHRGRLIARYMLSWQGPGDQCPRITGSVQCRFLGERISHIGEALPPARLREFLEPLVPCTGA